MSNLKKTILSKLHERTVSPEELKTNTDDLVKTAKDALDIDDTQAKDYVSGFIGEDNDEITSRGIDAGMNPEVEADKYAEYRALMAQLAAEEGEQEGPVKEDGSENVNQYVNRVGGAGMLANAKYSEGDKVSVDMGDGTVENLTIIKVNYFKPPKGKFSYLYYTLEYGEDMAFLEDMINDKVGSLKEAGEMNPEAEAKNDPVKLKADVARLMARLDMSGIAPYLDRIDNPVEQAEVIGQFAEKIGVPRARLGAVIAQLKQVAENTNPKITKNGLIETVTGRKIIKTIKVKDIK